MIAKIAVPLLAVTAAAFAVPASAAMPVAGATPLASESPIVQVAKKMKKRMTRQQELDRSIDNGTVPSRYRANVPREYQQYVPFERR